MASTVIPLRQSSVEASLKQASFEYLPLPVIAINAAAQVLSANVAAGQLLQRSPAELIGAPLSSLTAYKHDRHSARRWARLWARLQGAERQTLLTQLRLPGGQLALKIDATLLRFEQDCVAVLVLNDITQARIQRRADNQQRLREQLMQRAADSAALLIGADRRVLQVQVQVPAEWSASFNANEWNAIPFELLLDESSAAEFLRLFDAEPQAHEQTYRWRLRGRASATARWMSVTVVDRRRHPLINALLVYLRDTTAPVLTRPDQQLLERRLALLAETSTDVLMLIGEDGKVQYQGAAIKRLLGTAGTADTAGMTPSPSVGVSVYTLALIEDQPALRSLLQQAYANSNAAASHAALIRLNDADGNAHPFWLTVKNFIHEPAIGGFLVTACDLTQALQQANQNNNGQARRLEFREKLLELAVQSRTDFSQALVHLLRSTAHTLRASRVSFWRRLDSPSRLRCEVLYDAVANRFSRDWMGVELPAEADPAYFARLQERQPIGVADVRAPLLAPRYAEDPRWAEIKAMLDAPILLDGEVQGVLSVQHLQRRQWDEDEINFVSTAALMTALALEAAQRQEAESRIEQLAWYDSLTGLANRNLLRETMRDTLMTAMNRRRRVAVMLIDLDRFKDVNDTLGHLMGDALIKSASQVLQQTVGSQGTVARLGGDEFVVVMGEFAHRQEVALLAERITQALHRTDLVPNVDTQVSASIGVALFPEHGREISTLLKNADAAMYQAKRDGRNQFSFFNPIRAERAAREVHLGIQLLKAVQSDSAQFVVEYQPQVEMATGRVIGLEALIRWQHPTFGLLTPDRFIGVAEVSGLSERITRWVMNEVCAQIVRWRQVASGFDIPIAVNVAGREMGSVALPLLVRECLQKYSIEPHMLILEITERTLVKESEINNDVMAELASIGIGLSLDDFGTGYSMLGYLKRMPIQSLKIDQSFVEGVPDDADSRAIVHAMLAVARHFKLKVVAEGVENQSQVDYMRSIGCDYAQGYFYARPLPAQTLIEYVTKTDR